MPPLLPLILLLLLLLLLPPTTSLSLTAHCTSHSAKTAQTHCPCAARTTTPTFCLSATTSTTCQQSLCPTRHICDCAGKTLCRLVPQPTTLTCIAQISLTGTCPCTRVSSLSVTLPLPLRQNRPLHHPSALLPRDARFCTERPLFWTRPDGEALLLQHWRLVTSHDHLAQPTAPHPPVSAGDPAITPVLRFGHVGHAVSLSSPSALSAALREASDDLFPIDGDISDPGKGLVDRMSKECASAAVAVRLAGKGVATREAVRVVGMDVAERMVLQPCLLLPAENPAVGMSVATLLRLAAAATGHFPVDDAFLKREEAVQACAALNRNFEGCRVDLGCVAVMS